MLEGPYSGRVTGLLLAINVNNVARSAKPTSPPVGQNGVVEFADAQPASRFRLGES